MMYIINKLPLFLQKIIFKLEFCFVETIINTKIGAFPLLVMLWISKDKYWKKFLQGKSVYVSVYNQLAITQIAHERHSSRDSIPIETIHRLQRIAECREKRKEHELNLIDAELVYQKYLNKRNDRKY